jgi:hypothetical protein
MGYCQELRGSHPANLEISNRKFDNPAQMELKVYWGEIKQHAGIVWNILVDLVGWYNLKCTSGSCNIQ